MRAPATHVAEGEESELVACMTDIGLTNERDFPVPRCPREGGVGQRVP